MHVGNLGNELPNTSASDAKIRPLLKYSTWESKDVRNVILSHLYHLHDSKWSNYQHSYKNVNQLESKPSYPKTCPRNISTTIVRLRLGHCKYTHNHILNKSSPPLCTTCNMTITVTHILDECPDFNSSRISIFGTKTPSSLLTTICDNNINLIFKFILDNNLQNFV